jgi:hypothetical protein
MKRSLFVFVLLYLVMALGTLVFAGQPADTPAKNQGDSTMDYVPGEILVRFAPSVDSDQVAALGIDYSLSVQECIVTINLCRMKILDGSSEVDAAQRVSYDARVNLWGT